VTGFKDLLGSGDRTQKFTIKKVEMETEDDLPKSHTWYLIFL